MGDPPALISAVSDLSIAERVGLTLEDTSEIEAMVTLAPSYSPYDPTRHSQGRLRVNCVATSEAYDRLALPSAQLVIDAIERRHWEPPVVSVRDPRRESASTGRRSRAPESLAIDDDGLTRIVEDRWRVLGELIGIDREV